MYASVFTDYTPRHHCQQEPGQAFNASFASSDLYRCAVRQENGTVTTSCAAWAYDPSVYTATASSEYDIVCDRSYLKTLSGTLKMSGLLVGSLVFGWLSDRCGRVSSLTAAGLVLFAGQLANGFSPSYLVFSVMNLVTAAGGMGTYLVAFVLQFEWICRDWRTKASVLAQVPFAVGFLYLVFVSWCIRDWRTLQWALALPNLIYIAFPWVVPESPRWCLSRRRPDGARAALGKAARLAGRGRGELLPDDSLRGEEVDTDARAAGVGAGFSSRTLVLRLLVMSFNWVVITLCFYGLSLNSANSDLFVGMSAMAAAEIPAYVATVFVIETWGRRPVLSVCQLVAGMACVAAGFVPVDKYWPRLVLALVGKMGASSGFATVFVFTSELFPTPVRTSSLGLCSTLARVGALLAPLISGLDSFLPVLPFLLMGSGSILAGAASFLLPETKGARLPETIEEAEAIGTRKQCTDCGEVEI